MPVDDAFDIDEDNTLSARVDSNDVIPVGTFVSTQFTVVDQPSFGTVTLDATTGEFEYEPNEDFNGEDSFTYRLGTQTTTPLGTVSITVNPINDEPDFEIDAPLVGGTATINVLESDAGGITIDDFAVNIFAGPLTAIDEIATQGLTFEVTESSVVPVGLMTQLPELTAAGQLTIYPAPDAIGTATYTVTLTDDHPTDPRSSMTKTFVVNVLPVNDPPELDPAVAPSEDEFDNDDAYAVAVNGTITYTLREDNTQSDGSTPPFFIPLEGQVTAGYDRIGLLDVFDVGPANEVDGSPGGSQSLELVNAGIGSGPLTLDRTTDRGGTLSPVMQAGELIGFDYIPPTDFNFESGGFDSLTYEVRDDGTSFHLDNGTLDPDPMSRTNRVQFILNAVNDAPVFEVSTNQIVVQEDSAAVQITNFATDLGGGPPATAFDENDFQSLDALMFSITPANFDVADLASFFTTAPMIDSETGQLSFQTAKDVFGSYDFDIQLIDGGANDPTRGDVNTSASRTLTIDVLPVNDPPVVDPAQATLEYTLTEEGSIEIPIIGAGGVPGLLDAFAAGPLTLGGDESAAISPGGNQTVALGSPIPTATNKGGTLELLTTGGPPRLLYTPRGNFSGTDTFVYSVTDDGMSVDPSGTPFDDPRIAGNTVTLIVTPVNDAPLFGIPPLVQSDEDQGAVTVPGWATNVQAGPAMAKDEISGPNAQGLEFLFTQISGNMDLIIPGSLSASVNALDGTASLMYESAANQTGTATFEVVLRDDGPSDGPGDQNTSSRSHVHDRSCRGQRSTILQFCQQRSSHRDRRWWSIHRSLVGKHWRWSSR